MGVMPDRFTVTQNVDHTVVAPMNKQTYHVWHIMDAVTGKMICSTYGPNSYPAALLLCETYNKLGGPMPVQLEKQKED